jgi:mannose/fructose-specific phosphotransferase system component IIA
MSESALNFARLKGEDHAVCAGINLPYAVRTKSAQEKYADHPCVHDAREEAARERYELDYDPYDVYGLSRRDFA